MTNPRQLTKLHQVRKPTAYLVAGQVCSGKTSTSKLLEEYTGAVRFTPDEWMIKLYPDKVSCEEFDRIFYTFCELSWSVAEKCLARGINVILDFGFWKKKDRDYYLETLTQSGYQCHLVYVKCEDSTIRKRLRIRNRNLPEGTFHIPEKDYDFFSPGFEEPGANEKFLTFDNNAEDRMKSRFDKWLDNNGQLTMEN